MEITIKKTVIFDVDGVLFEYNGWKGVDHYGEPIQANVDALKGMYDAGMEICIWTTRTNPLVQGYPQEQLVKALEAQLKKYDIPYSKILLEPKPLFTMLIDDNSFNPNRDRYCVLKADIEKAYFTATNEFLSFPS